MVTGVQTVLPIFEIHVTANDCYVHYAKDAEEYRSIIEGILHDHGVRKLVKSKSMLSEECHLNPFLIEKGYEIERAERGASEGCSAERRKRR